MSFEVLLAERPRRCLALELPFLPVRHEDTGPVELSEDKSSESAPDVVLVVRLLDVLEIGRMIDDVHPVEGDRQFVGRAVTLIERVPQLGAAFAFRVEVSRVTAEESTARPTDPWSVR